MVTGAFAFSSVSTMRFIGVGMILALVLDATVVRVLLVPALLRLLGEVSWWGPGALRRRQGRVGIRDGEQLPFRETRLPGRRLAGPVHPVRRSLH